MHKTAFIFHGTEGYPEENWFPWLKQKLEEQGLEVFVPQFPSPPGQPASVNEWFSVLEDFKQHINQDTILVGHSLGGLFILKILEQLQSPVKLTALVAAPVGVRPILNFERDSAFCGFNFNWEKIKSNSKNFLVYQSDNDPYVSLGNGEELAKQLGVNLNFIPNSGHFNTSAGYIEFPQLLQDILNNL